MLWILIRSASEVLLISTQNICFPRKIRKNVNTAFTEKKSILSRDMQKGHHLSVFKINACFTRVHEKILLEPTIYNVILSIGTDRPLQTV